MTKLNKQGKQAAIIAAVLIALAVTCRMLGNNGFYPKTLWLVRSGIYIFLIVAWGVLIVLIFESCIGCGLIQSNSYYTELFQASTFAAEPLRCISTLPTVPTKTMSVGLPYRP